MLSRAFGLIPLLLIAGCAGGPLKIPTTGPVPAEWRNAADFPVASPERDLSRWWRSFEDPTLNRLIEDGLAQSPDMASATARVREARANRKITEAALYPSISGSAARSTQSVDTDTTGRRTSTGYSAGLNASWEVDLYGRNRSNLAAASAALGAAEENLRSVQASLAAEIAAAYTSLRAAETGLGILQRNIAIQEETFQFTDWRRQVGEADALEATQAEASLEQSRGAIPSLQQNIAQTRNLLARLCGREPGALDGFLKSSGNDIPSPARRLAVGIPADTIRQRPDVRIAGYQLISAVARTRAAEAERFPSLSLSGSLGLSSLSSTKIYNPESVAAGIVAGLAGPVFDAGRIRANIDASDAATDQALEAYRASILTALSEVEDSLIACRRSAERLAALEKATRLAREADQLARQRYKAGEIDFLTVLDSQRTLLSLEDSRLTTQTDRTTAYIRLYQALGGGWSAGS